MFNLPSAHTTQIYSTLTVGYIAVYSLFTHYNMNIIIILAKPLHNRYIVSVHFNHFHCMGIWDKLSKHTSVLTYIYLNVDEC